MGFGSRAGGAGGEMAAPLSFPGVGLGGQEHRAGSPTTLYGPLDHHCGGAASSGAVLNTGRLYAYPTKFARNARISKIYVAAAAQEKRIGLYRGKIGDPLYPGQLIWQGSTIGGGGGEGSSFVTLDGSGTVEAGEIIFFAISVSVNAMDAFARQFSDLRKTGFLGLFIPSGSSFIRVGYAAVFGHTTLPSVYPAGAPYMSNGGAPDISGTNGTGSIGYPMYEVA